MKQVKGLAITIGLLSLILLITGAAYAGTKTFGQNSYIISVDPCWQPTKNTNISVPYKAGCETNRNDQGIFQTQGLIYSMLDTGDDPQNCRNNDGSSPFQKKVLGYCKAIPIYWMIKKDKTGPDDVDLSIAGDGSNHVVDIYDYSSGSTTPYNPGPGTIDPVEYMGGPYVIDANDITFAEMSLFMSTYPNVKVHKAKFAFSGNVEKILIGRPPRVAVLNEGAITVLRDYLRASGLFNWEDYVFVQLNARDIMAGCLEDPIPASCTARRPDITSPFQLIWAPHWVVEDSWSDGNPTLQDQNDVIEKLRGFVEEGNAAFFECASIESLEGSQDVNKANKFAGNEYDQPLDMSNSNLGGFLISRANNPPRVDTNGGCGDTGGCGANYLVYETPDFWLTQCGGWSYDTTGGHVHNVRPKDSADSTKRRSYLTTLPLDDLATPEDDRFVGSNLTRFIHDDPALVDYSPSSGYYVYDYLVGGRINGAPTQGYIIYFPGHKYIQCQNTGTSEVPERLMDFHFDSDLAGSSVVTAELIHPFCTPGATCPTASFTVATGDGTSAVDSYAYIDMDSASYSYDPLTGGTLKDIIIGNKTSGNLSVLDIMVTFTDSPAVKLTDIEDVSDRASTFIVCDSGTNSNLPGLSPVSCAGVGGVSGDDIKFTFSGSDIKTDDPSNKDVTVEILHSGCNQGYDCPTATYNLSTGTQTASSPDGSNMIYLDMSSASYIYDSGTMTGVLSGIKFADIEANCGNVTIDDIYVDFPGITATLDTIYNTSKTENICSPASTSQAKCTGTTSPPPASSCPQGTFEIGGNKVSDDDGVLKVDMSSAEFDGKFKKLKKIKIKNIGCGTQGAGNPTDNYKLYLTSMEIGFPDSNSSLNKFKKAKNICDPNPDVDNSPATCTPGSPYEIGKFNDKKETELEFSNPHNNTGVVTLKVGWQCDDGTDCTIGVGGGGGSSWSYTLTSALDCAFNYNLASFTSTCNIDWNKSNTCGVRYVLNTLLALKYQIVTNEFSKTQSVVKDNILYKTSYDYPVYRGHLDMIDVPTDQQAQAQKVWDAADAVPLAGVAGFPSGPDINNTIRYIFTRDPSNGSVIKFDSSASNASALRTLLGVTTDADAKVLINTVRGREDATTVNPDGIGELDDKLWAFENSTPALMAGSSLVSGAANRDRILFAGAADGMFHAFWAGSWDAGASTYTDGTGEEIWAYIPSALLSYLQNQPFEPDPADYSTFEPVVSVDGAPALSDFLVDPDGDGNYEWKTYVVETAMIKSLNKGIIFAMDVSDPYAPTLLWEYTYDDTGVGVDKCGDDAGTNEKNCNMGNSKGVAIGRVQVGGEIKSLVFVTASWIDKKNPADYTQDCAGDPTNCVYGVSAYAIDLLTGDVVWETKLPYTGDATGVNDTPAIPALMDIDNNGTHDYVIFGDFQGRLWGLRTTDGESMAGVETAAGDDKPVFVVHKEPEPILLAMHGNALPAFEVPDTNSNPVGAAEPIGAPVSVYRNIVVFGTGGADYASDSSNYHVFTISLNPGTSTSQVWTLKDTYTTNVGEKVWTKPVIDQNLNVFVATSKDYYSQTLDVSSLNSKGRIIIIGLKSGIDTIVNENVNNGWFDGGFVGGLDIDRRHTYAVTFSSSGSPFNTIQIGGEVFTPTTSTENPFKVLWWKRF